MVYRMLPLSTTFLKRGAYTFCTKVHIGKCFGQHNEGKPCAGNPHARFKEGAWVETPALIYGQNR